MRARRDVSDEVRRAEVAASLAAARSVEAELHAPAEDTTEWRDGALWVHQREQIDSPVPTGWWVCHECFDGPDGSGARRVAVAQHRGDAYARGRANASRWPRPANVPYPALGYPPGPTRDYPAQLGDDPGLHEPETLPETLRDRIRRLALLRRLARRLLR